MTTDNCGKVTYYISGSITHIFLKFLYLDYHSWTYITTNFQYHSLSFYILRNKTFSRQQTIWIVTIYGERKAVGGNTASKQAE